MAGEEFAVVAVGPSDGAVICDADGFVSDDGLRGEIDGDFRGRFGRVSGVPLAEFGCGTCDGVSMAVIGDAESNRLCGRVDDGLFDGFVDEQFDGIGADGSWSADGASDFGIVPFSGGKFEQLPFGSEIDGDKRLFILELASEDDETGLVFVSSRDAFCKYGMECAESESTLNDGEKVCAVEVHVGAIFGFLVTCEGDFRTIENAWNSAPGKHDTERV